MKREKSDRTDLDTQKLEYWIYDIMDDRPFEARNVDLTYRGRTGSFSNTNYLRGVATFFNQQGSIKQAHDHFVQDGYEGVMIRDSKAGYLYGHRGRELFKYKEFIDKEFTIVGGKEGTGRDGIWLTFNDFDEARAMFESHPLACGLNPGPFDNGYGL